MSTNQVEHMIGRAVDEAVGRMSMAEVRDLMVAPYIEIRDAMHEWAHEAIDAAFDK